MTFRHRLPLCQRIMYILLVDWPTLMPSSVCMETPTTRNPAISLSPLTTKTSPLAKLTTSMAHSSLAMTKAQAPSAVQCTSQAVEFRSWGIRLPLNQIWVEQKMMLFLGFVATLTSCCWGWLHFRTEVHWVLGLGFGLWDIIVAGLCYSTDVIMFFLPINLKRVNHSLIQFSAPDVIQFIGFCQIPKMQANTTYQTIEIYMACRNIRDLDFFSKSDPYIQVSYRRDFNCKNYAKLGRTETINNNLNPNFTKPVTLDYIFESRQDIKFDVWDDDNGNDDFIGTVETTVGALMGAKGQTSILDIKNQDKNMGKLIVRCEKVGLSNQNYQFKFRAQKLMNTDSFFDFWDKSDPYLKLLKIRTDNSYIQSYKSEIIKNDLNPNWKQFSIQASRLHEETTGRFKLEVWDFQESGKDQFIGEVFLDANDLKKQSNFPMQINLSNPKSKNPGHLVLQRFRTFTRPTFVDYLKGGLELNMVIAIDFTGSNGTPTSPSSLHYMDRTKPNQYQAAIQAIAQILLNYDTDKKIPAFGFGADLRFPQMRGLSHCFPLSGDFGNVESVGLPHLMQLYQGALMNLSLSGPTYFGPIIEQVSQIAHNCKQGQAYVYQTLLILTDGQIHDMDKVVDLIINCSNLPLSIIIVGIGNANFDNMDRLDGDSGLYGSKGQRATRDIVQFVPFRDVQFNPDVLAKQLLAQLPGQVVQYYQALGIQPNIPPPSMNISQMLPPTQQQGPNFGNMAEMLVQHTEQKKEEPKNPYGVIEMQ